MCAATNLRNGLYRAFMPLIDTGAEITILSTNLLMLLGIDRNTLVEAPIDGIGGGRPAWVCDYIQISFLDVRPGNVKEHFPNKGSHVPLKFTEGSFNLLGQELFLDLCIMKFNGPKKETLVRF
jgi:hypothetical protein